MSRSKIKGKQVLMKTLSLLMAVFFTFGLITVAIPSEAYAAKKAKTEESFTVTSFKWEKKSADITLTAPDSFLQAKLTVKVKNSVKNSNCVAVTIENTKTKVKQTKHTGKSGGTVFFMFDSTKKNAGAWEVISVSAAKRTEKKVGTSPGYWDHWGKWNPPIDVIAVSYENLKTVKQKDKNGFNLLRGADTTLMLNISKSLLASEANASVSATLKDEKGKALANETIRFLLVPGNSPGRISSANKPTIVTARTNSSGIATVNVQVPRLPYDNYEFLGFTTSAYYEGKAKKYCVSQSTSVATSQPKEATAFVAAPIWDGHTGTRTFTSKLVVSGGPNDGKAVSGIPIEWIFWNRGSMHHTDDNAVTNASGETSTIWTLQQGDWLDYEVTLSSKLSSMLNTPYAPPATKTYQLTKQQGTKNYTVDWSKVILLGGSTGDAGNWFSASAASKAFITVASMEGILIGTDGAPLPQIGGVDPRTINCSIRSVEGGSGYLFQNQSIQFSLNATNTLPNASSNRKSVDSAARTSTKVEVIFTLPTFEHAFYQEYKYVPITQTVSKIFP